MDTKTTTSYGELLFQRLDELPGEQPLYSGLKAHELKILKDSLPVGSIQAIATECSISYNSVWSIMTGKWNNRQVIAVAFTKLHHEKLEPTRSAYLHSVFDTLFGKEGSGKNRAN